MEASGVQSAQPSSLEDIQLKQEHYVLTVQKGKGDKSRDVPLRPDVFRAISSYLEATDRLNDAPSSPLFTGFLKGQKATRSGITDRQIANIVEGYARSPDSPVHRTI